VGVGISKKGVKGRKEFIEMVHIGQYGRRRAEQLAEKRRSR